MQRSHGFIQMISTVGRWRKGGPPNSAASRLRNFRGRIEGCGFTAKRSRAGKTGKEGRERREQNGGSQYEVPLRTEFLNTLRVRTAYRAGILSTQYQWSLAFAHVKYPQSAIFDYAWLYHRG
jgi:hypothetical protein